MPWPNDAAKTAAPYELPYPGTRNLADVPTDLKKLADATAVSLNLKLDKASPSDVPSNYQKKVTVQTTVPLPSQTGQDGDIIFVVLP